MFESINKSIERAKRRRLDALARFHIGDVCYPLYQTWMPVIWGIIVDINVTTHKISVNLNGVIRQYDPEELVLTSPEDKEPNTTNEDRQRVLDEIERTVSSAFWASKANRIAKKLTASFGKKKLDQKLFLLKTVSAVENYIQKKVEPYTKGLKRDNWGAIHKIIEVLQDLGVDAECTGVDSSNYKIEGGSKKWNYILSFVNVAGKKVEIYYQIIGSAAGTVDDPWGAYDILAGPTYGRMIKASVKKADLSPEMQELSDTIDDNQALDLTFSSIRLLYHYLKVHYDGTNRQKWSDRELTNSRNEIRECIDKAKSREVKNLLDEVLKTFARIRNEKDSLKEGMERLEKIVPKVQKMQKEKRELERTQRQRSQKNSDKKAFLNDKPQYKFFVVVEDPSNGDKKIESGWARVQEAKDMIRALPRYLNPGLDDKKPVSREDLKKLNLDPRKAEHWFTASKKIFAKTSRDTEKLFEPIQLALADYTAGSYTTGAALKLIRDFGECVEKSMKLCDQNRFSDAVRELNFIGKNLKQLNPMTGSWKRWNLPLGSYHNIYRHYWKQLGDAYFEVRKALDERDYYNNDYSIED